MDLNRANFPYASSGQQNAAFPYIELRLTYIWGLILESSPSFPIDNDLWQK